MQTYSPQPHLIQLLHTSLGRQGDEPLSTLGVLLILPLGLHTFLENVVVASSLDFRGRLQIVEQTAYEIGPNSMRHGSRTQGKERE
jgi:hypothetical protein